MEEHFPFKPPILDRIYGELRELLAQGMPEEEAYRVVIGKYVRVRKIHPRLTNFSPELVVFLAWVESFLNQHFGEHFHVALMIAREMEGEAVGKRIEFFPLKWPLKDVISTVAYLEHIQRVKPPPKQKVLQGLKMRRHRGGLIVEFEKKKLLEMIREDEKGHTNRADSEDEDHLPPSGD